MRMGVNTPPTAFGKLTLQRPFGFFCVGFAAAIQCIKTCGKTFVFRQRLERERFDGFEFVARHEIHVGDQFLEALFHESFNFGPRALRRTSGVRGEFGETIEKGILRLHRDMSLFRLLYWGSARWRQGPVATP